MKIKRTESDIAKAALVWLNTRPGTFARKVHTTGIPNGKKGFRTNPNRGMSDIVGLVNGIFIAIEMKVGRGVVSPEQERFIKSVKDCRGVAGVARSIEDVESLWTEADNRVHLK